MGMAMVAARIDEPSAGAGDAKVLPRCALSGEEAAAARRCARWPAEVAPFTKTVRAVGQVAIDERRMQHVHTKIQGWIEHLHAGAVGETGAARRSVADDLLARASREPARVPGRARPARARRVVDCRTSIADADRLVEAATPAAPAPGHDAQRRSSSSRERARRRRSSRCTRPSPARSRRETSATAKRIESATSLLRHRGSRARLGARRMSTNRSFRSCTTGRGRDRAVVPSGTYVHADACRWCRRSSMPTTRTVKVRVELDNRDLALRPGMFANVELHADLGTRLAVPKDAVLQSGTRNVVFVSPTDGSFEPRRSSWAWSFPIDGRSREGTRRRRATCSPPRTSSSMRNRS